MRVAGPPSARSEVMYSHAAGRWFEVASADRPGLIIYAYRSMPNQEAALTHEDRSMLQNLHVPLRGVYACRAEIKNRRVSFIASFDRDALQQYVAREAKLWR